VHRIKDLETYSLIRQLRQDLLKILQSTPLEIFRKAESKFSKAKRHRGGIPHGMLKSDTGSSAPDFVMGNNFSLGCFNGNYCLPKHRCRMGNNFKQLFLIKIQCKSKNGTLFAIYDVNIFNRNAFYKNIKDGEIMALKITLKSRERMIIGGAVVTNGSNTSKLIIENNVPVLRQKDIMSHADATTPCNRIYFILQLMYIDQENIHTYHKKYWKLVHEVLSNAPSFSAFLEQTSTHILGGRYYQALKLAKEMINYEQEVLSNVFITAKTNTSDTHESTENRTEDRRRSAH
jgi:flagellar biosynthesis repressor protein FlbT